MKIRTKILPIALMLASAVGFVFAQQDDKKTPPKTSPPKVIVPPRNDREKPKDTGNSNSNDNRGSRPRDND